MEDETATATGTAPGIMPSASTTVAVQMVATLKHAREHDHAATERRLIVEALQRFRGNKRAVARHLEIAPQTLCRLLEKHGIFAGA